MALTNWVSSSSGMHSYEGFTASGLRTNGPEKGPSRQMTRVSLNEAKYKNKLVSE